MEMRPGKGQCLRAGLIGCFLKVLREGGRGRSAFVLLPFYSALPSALPWAVGSILCLCSAVGGRTPVGGTLVTPLF